MAGYTPTEYQSRVGWGHSTWEEGIQVARDANVKELMLFHHDPDHSDLFLDKMLLEARARFPRVHAAMEGTTISVERAQQGATFRGRMEQRYSPRVLLANPIRALLRRVGQNESQRTLLSDLNLDGSFFLVDHELGDGTELEVEIDLPIGKDSPTNLLHLRGTVVRSEKVGEKTGIGVSFRTRLPSPE